MKLLLRSEDSFNKIETEAYIQQSALTHIIHTPFYHILNEEIQKFHQVANL